MIFKYIGNTVRKEFSFGSICYIFLCPFCHISIFSKSNVCKLTTTIRFFRTKSTNSYVSKISSNM